jgi:hypothetical protein
MQQILQTRTANANDKKIMLTLGEKEDLSMINLKYTKIIKKNTFILRLVE